MKKISFILLMLFMFTLGGCTKSDSALTDILAKNKLIVATSADFPPFEYIDGDEFLGFDIELVKAFANYLNVGIEFKDQDFDGALLSVATGKAHLAVAGITVNEKRLESMSFSKGYFQASQVIIVKENSIINGTTIKELESSLSNNLARIGVQRGTVAQFYVEGDEDWEYPGITNTTCTVYDSGALAVVALNQGKVDAVMIDEAPARKFVEKNPGLKIINVLLTDEEYAIATKHGDKDLVAKLNEFIDAFKTSGEFTALLNKYFGDE